MLLDANLLIYAVDRRAGHHARAAAWLTEQLNGPRRVGLPWQTLNAFMRIVTHPRIYREPTPLSKALEFVDVLRQGPTFLPISPGERHWAIFSELCARVEATGNDIPDAFLAALAIENGATWISADRGFSRFPGLRWQHPLDT